jgi:hypothetical protein
MPVSGGTSAQGRSRAIAQRVRQGAVIAFVAGRPAMIDEGFVEDEAWLGLGLARTSALDPKPVALLQLGSVGGHRVVGGLRGMERRPGAGGGRE